MLLKEFSKIIRGGQDIRSFTKSVDAGRDPNNKIHQITYTNGESVITIRIYNFTTKDPKDYFDV